jgi:hypothetical protein
MARSRMHRRYVKQLKNNPPIFTEVLEFAVPGFGGFAATRLVTRIAMTQISQRAPSWGKHAGAVASIGSFLAAWFLANKVRWLERWHTPLVVGSAIAAAQSLLQIYAPNVLGWIVSDATPDVTAAAQSAISAPDQQLAQLQLQPTNEDPSQFVYNDSYDAGRYSGSHGPSSMKVGAAVPPSPSGQAQTADQAADPSDLAIDDALGAANLGVFANAN